MSIDGFYNKEQEKAPFLHLSADLEHQILHDRECGYVSPYSFRDEDAVRRRVRPHDKSTVMRSAFDRDVEKIMYVPPYNRYNDKTQVFSFLYNDDVSRRGLHVQYVSKIARNIGGLLGLNTKLIEAIAIGHDIGHTPFGHIGERFLNKISLENTGRYFYHNLHSVRVLDKLYPRNLSLQTLDGILCHNGEIEMKKIKCGNIKTFEDFDSVVEKCYGDEKLIGELVSSTLEGCVVRMADIVAYLGKDRIDALHAKAIPDLKCFDTTILGIMNTTIINNLTVDLVENSYGRDCIALSDEMFEDMSRAKTQNYDLIYSKKAMTDGSQEIIEDYMQKVYDRCIKDLESGDPSRPIYKHHIVSLTQNSFCYDVEAYLSEGLDAVVIDYIASMTDTYFLALCNKMFPESRDLSFFRGYFQLD